MDMRNMKNMKRRMLSLLLVLALFSWMIGTGNVSEAKTTVCLNKKKVTLKVGGRTTLKLKNYKKKVTWSSSKKSVATVSSKGVVRAKKKGTAKITARAGKKKYVCRVRVTLPKSEQQSSTGNSTVTSDGDVAKQYAQNVLELVNKERSAQGLSPLTLDDSLCQAAQIRAGEITSKFSHTRPDGTTCFTVLKELGISYRTVGENIAAGQSSPQSVMESWMNSPGHRENILTGSFTKLGVGYVKAEDGYRYYWVQMFKG